MSGTAQKTPIARTLEQWSQRKVRSALDLLGKSLPASVVSRDGAIVTVKFELASTVPFTLPNVTVPLIGSEFIRLPINKGVMGFVISADVYLGGVSGLGGGTADLSTPSNLGALVFVPIGNKNWSAPTDVDATELYGPHGVILRNMDSTGVVKVTATNITLTFGANSITIDNAGIHLVGPITSDGTISGVGGTINFGSTNLTTAGLVTSNGKVLSTHEHGGVQTGGGTSGPPV